MTYDEFTNSFLPEFKKINSFANKIKYASEHLNKIGAGSSRIVYDIDGEKVLKLAKNSKGIAQNAEELELKDDYMAKGVIAEIFEYDNNSQWIVAEKAKKVNEKRIIELTGIPNLIVLQQFLYENRQDYRGTHQLDKRISEELWNNEFAIGLVDFVNSFKQKTGDLGRPSSYGEVLHDGQPTIVLTDYGLSDEVYDTHYSPYRKQVSIYEMYGFQDGNDDILSDIGNTGEVRHSMWALMPQDVGDGDVIDENFISFVLNRDKYPTRTLPSTPYLLDKFHETINNLKETLNHVQDKKKFYNNLLELQNYLIRGKFYDREPIEEHVMSLGEGVADLTDPISEEYGTKIASELAKKLNLGQPQYLGGGEFGRAFLINGNKVLKLTSDSGEVDAAAKIQRGEPKVLANVYNIYKVYDSEADRGIYALIEQYVPEKPTKEFDRLTDLLAGIETEAYGGDLYGALIRLIAKGSNPKVFPGKTFDDFPEMATIITNGKSNTNISNADREKVYKFMLGLYEIKKELNALDIKSKDFFEARNLGYLNGVLTMFDVGGYSAPELEVQPDNMVTLPEGENLLTEKVSKNIADRIANQVAEKNGYNTPNYIGEGTNGVAYDIGNDMVLKVTDDRTEAIENLNLMGKPLKYIAQPYKVFSIKSNEIKKEIFVIVLEKLRTDADSIEAMIDRLNYGFNKILNVYLDDVIASIVHGEDNGINIEKIRKYLSKNPQDSKFFNSILNIAKEAKKYGYVNGEYLNPDNLGYKKNGNLGFFDLGYGQNIAFSDKFPTPIEVNEDGTSLYSTDNSIGSDDFPSYDQNDDSPMTDNNVPANTGMYEDFNYEHASDATQDEYVINEGIKSSMPNSSSVEVKKKCRLAGNGNTSTACNQGDIGNLNLKPLSELFEDYTNEIVDILKKSNNEGVADVNSDNKFAFDEGNDEIFNNFVRKSNKSRIVKESLISSDKNFYNNADTNKLKRAFDMADKYYSMVANKKYLSGEDVDELVYVYNLIGGNYPLSLKILGNKDFAKLYSFIRNVLKKRGLLKEQKSPNVTNENKSNVNCHPISLTPEIIDYLKKFKSDEELLRSGGLPTDLLDLAAYGFNPDTLKQIMPKQLSIKWKDDYQNVLYEVRKSGLSKAAWAKKINLTEPIDVSFNGKKFYIEDGHHRYFAAKTLGLPLNMNLEIKANPITKLGGDLGYDDFHRCIWKQVNTNNSVGNSLDENKQQMEKAYVKTGIYDNDDVSAILNITGGDAWTKLIADMYYFFGDRYQENGIWKIKSKKLSPNELNALIEAHELLLRYNKNTLPIHDLYAQEQNAHPVEKWQDLRTREAIISRLRKFPSIMLRNLGNDIRKERQHWEIETLFQQVIEIENTLKLLEQVKPEKKEIIYKKIFSSNNDSFAAIQKRLEDTALPYLSQDEELPDMEGKVSDMGDEAEILYSQNNVLVVVIKSSEAMKYLGCSSQWCFATESTDFYWEEYAEENRFPIIVYNFNEEPSEPQRMVVVLPNSEVYTMYNEPLNDGWLYLRELGISDIVFKYKPEYEEVDD